jgi:hypothetical protein
MSLCSVSEKTDSKFITCIGNSLFISHYTELFINSTVIFQINDCKQIPIIIPNKKFYKQFALLFERAVSIKKLLIYQKLSKTKANEMLNSIQIDLDELVIHLYGMDN